MQKGLSIKGLELIKRILLNDSIGFSPFLAIIFIGTNQKIVDMMIEIIHCRGSNVDVFLQLCSLAYIQEFENRSANCRLLESEEFHNVQYYSEIIPKEQCCKIADRLCKIVEEGMASRQSRVGNHNFVSALLVPFSYIRRYTNQGLHFLGKYRIQKVLSLFSNWLAGMQCNPTSSKPNWSSTESSLFVMLQTIFQASAVEVPDTSLLTMMPQLLSMPE